MDQAEFTVDALAGFPIFAGLSKEQKLPFLQGHRLVRLGESQPVVQQADWNDGVFLIVHGIAKVRRFTMEGEEVVVGLVGIGEIFGEQALLIEGGLRSADVISLTPLEIVKLRSAPFEQALTEIPGFTRAMARLQAERLRELGERFALRGEDATTRVMATLLALARKGNASRDPQHPIPALVQREIATIAGLSRGTTSTILTRLRSVGTLVDAADGLRIANLEPLQRRHLLEL